MILIRFLTEIAVWPDPLSHIPANTEDHLHGDSIGKRAFALGAVEAG
jgi:hypothetical protein